jgi:two-component system chemotaxis response regulator CheB
MPDAPTRILLVDDSAMARTILSRIFTSAPDIEVVGTAQQGDEALEMVVKLDPTVVCTDLHMPVMDGLELTKQIMENHPRPILVISNAVQEDDKANVFELLQGGALDVFPKPRSGTTADYERVAKDLIRKVRVLAGVRVIRKRQRKVLGGATPRATLPPVGGAKKAAQPRLVVVGASTGGPQAFYAILSELPADFPVPILCVQHIGEGFLQSMVNWLNSKCALEVRIFENGEKPVRGTVYFATDGRHLELDSKGCLVRSDSAPIEGHRPSVTHTFNSAAARMGGSVVGVLLTGMGRDGADGMMAIVKAGGVTVAQNEETCVVYGMPRRAVEIGAAQHVLSLDKIAAKLKQLCLVPS